MMRKFQSEKMRRTMYEWHGGQNSPLYAAASSGLVASMPALQCEIRACAEYLWSDSANFKTSAYVDGKPKQKHMGASVYREWQYLQDLADYLPQRFKTEIVVCGRAYIVLPWISRTYFAKRCRISPIKPWLTKKG